MAAAWVARMKYPDAEFKPMRYDEILDFKSVGGRDVLILDFSFKRPILEAVHAIARSLLVIDHHKTAQADLVDLSYCTFDMTRSGAGLTFDLLFLGEPRPWIIDYIEDRDLWRHSLPGSREIGASLQELPIGMPNEPLNFQAWDDYHLTMTILKALRAGHAHLQTIERLTLQIAKNAQACTLVGHPCMVATSSILFSEVGERLTDKYPMGVVVYQRADGKWSYSLRSRSDFDVSAVARMFGGGGHQQSAGFVSDSPVHVPAFEVTG